MFASILRLLQGCVKFWRSANDIVLANGFDGVLPTEQSIQMTTNPACAQRRLAQSPMLLQRISRAPGSGNNPSRPQRCNQWCQPDRPRGFGADTLVGSLGNEYYRPGCSRISAPHIDSEAPASNLDPEEAPVEARVKHIVCPLMDAGAPADDATPTHAGPPAALRFDAGSSSWMMPQPNDVSIVSDVFGCFDPWADAPRNAPSGPPVCFGLARTQSNAGSTRFEPIAFGQPRSERSLASGAGTPNGLQATSTSNEPLMPRMATLRQHPDLAAAIRAATPFGAPR
eukprot:4198655-Pyramimonas_sp.AAC.1